MLNVKRLQKERRHIIDCENVYATHITRKKIITPGYKEHVQIKNWMTNNLTER